MPPCTLEKDLGPPAGVHGHQVFVYGRCCPRLHAWSSSSSRRHIVLLYGRRPLCAPQPRAPSMAAMSGQSSRRWAGACTLLCHHTRRVVGRAMAGEHMRADCHAAARQARERATVSGHLVLRGRSAVVIHVSQHLEGVEQEHAAAEEGLIGGE
jgi:hypothetical protein